MNIRVQRVYYLRRSSDGTVLEKIASIIALKCGRVERFNIVSVQHEHPSLE